MCRWLRNLIEEMQGGKRGLASGIHLASEQFRQVAGIDAIHVPYRGGGPAILDFVGGKIDFTFTTIPSIIEHVRAGRVRPLGVTTGRVPQMPDVPSMAEAGFPAVDAALDIGIVAPVKVPSDALDKLSAIAAEAVRTDPLRQRLIDIGYQPVGSTPDVFRKHIDSEIEKWSRVVVAGNIKPE
jgi:tripartite-type tricarboxylate transporter receptor subunit TctC